MPAPRDRTKATTKPKATLEGLVDTYRASFDAAQADLPRHGIGKKGGTWAYDQTTQQLRFTSSGATVVAQASLLGSWSNESWLWAWANGSILKPVARAAREVKKLGKRLGVSELVEPFCFASAEHVERLAVVSRALLEAKGCYFPATATGKLVFVIHSIAEPNGA